MKVLRTEVIAVCENGKFRGIVTQRDVVNVLATAGEPLKESAGSMMNKNWPVVSPDEDILRAADVMVSSGVRVLPVVNDGKLLGLLSLANLAQKSRGIAAVVYCKAIKLETLCAAQARESVALAETT